MHIIASFLFSLRMATALRAQVFPATGPGRSSLRRSSLATGTRRRVKAWQSIAEPAHVAASVRRHFFQAFVDRRRQMLEELQCSEVRV